MAEAMRGERNKYFRRQRRSSTPSTYAHQGQWRSPSPRSPSPVAPKRPRRDREEYYRRYNMSGGGYDGGDYAEERFPGCHMNHISDWRDCGCSSFSNGSNNGQTTGVGLMSYKQFVLRLEDDILPYEAAHRYEEYRSEYISTEKPAFFKAHKEEDWLKDKYHPTNLMRVKERRNEHAREVAEDFLLYLLSDPSDLDPCMSSMNKSGDSGHGSVPDFDDEEHSTAELRTQGRDPVKENDCDAASKTHPISSEPRRIQVDIKLIQDLVHKLDSEKCIEGNILSTVKALEGGELLDTLIGYLWCVHGVDYYRMSEKSEPNSFWHAKAKYMTYDEANKVMVNWEKKLISFWERRLGGQDPLETLITKNEIVSAATIESLDPYVQKIRDEKYGVKYGCGAQGCRKVFFADKFVHMHLKLKHPELVMQLTPRLCEYQYFCNYMSDPDAPVRTPVMQRAALVPRCRPVLNDHSSIDQDCLGEHDFDRTYGQDRCDKAVVMRMLRYQDGPSPFERFGSPIGRK